MTRYLLFNAETYRYLTFIIPISLTGLKQVYKNKENKEKRREYISVQTEFKRLIYNSILFAYSTPT